MPEKTEQMSGGREYCGPSDQQKGHSINIHRDYIRTSGFVLQTKVDQRLFLDKMEPKKATEKFFEDYCQRCILLRMNQ